MSDTAAPRLGLRAAPWLLWFGVLGGAIAWTLHTLADWGIVETVCRSGHDEMVGVPLRPLVAGLALFFLAFAVASAIVSYRHWRLLGHAEEDVPAPGEGGRVTSSADELLMLRRRRASFMALVGLVGNVLFILMIAFSAGAVLVLPACAGGP